MSREEIFAIIKDFMPVRFKIQPSDKAPDKEHWIEAHSPTDLRIDPEHGISLSCEVNVHWPLPILPDDFTLKEVRGALVPEVVCRDGESVLLLRVELLELDAKYLPAFIDEALQKKVQEAISLLEAKLAWRITETMSVAVELPRWLEPRVVSEVTAHDATVELTEEMMRISMPLTVDMKHGDGFKADISFAQAEELAEELEIGGMLGKLIA